MRARMRGVERQKLNCCFCNPYIELNDIDKQRKCIEVTECFRRQFDQLKAENEELKVMFKDLSYENQKFSYQIEEQTKQLEPFKDEYFKELETIVIAELAKKSIRITAENRKLEQTLAEIKEIAEDTKDKFYDAIHTGGLYERLEQIIRKINEVEDVENN